MSGALAKIQAGGQLSAIYPQTFDDVVRFARMAVKAGLFIPARVKDEEKEAAEEKAIAQASMCLMHGMELDIPPLQALAGIAIINGKACIYGDLVPAILWSKGFEIDEEVTGEGRELRAVCTITRPGGKKITREFTAKQAMTAGLWDERAKVKRRIWENGSQVWKEVDNDSTWHCYPDRMVQMRARGRCSDDGAPDALRGMRIREVMEDTVRQQQQEDLPPPSQDTIQIPDIDDVVPVKQIEADPSEPTVAEAYDAAWRADVIESLKLGLEGAKTIEDVKELWEEMAENVEILDGADRDKAEALYNARIAALEGVNG